MLDEVAGPLKLGVTGIYEFCVILSDLAHTGNTEYIRTAYRRSFVEFVENVSEDKNYDDFQTKRS